MKLLEKLLEKIETETRPEWTLPLDHSKQPTKAELVDKDWTSGPELPEGWDLKLTGEAYAEWGVYNDEEDLLQEDFAMIGNQVVLDETDTWLRLGIGLKGGGSLKVSYGVLEGGVEAAAEGSVSWLLPGDPDDSPLDVVRERISEMWRGQDPFSPGEALPVGGGMEIVFDGSVGVSVGVDLSDLVGLGVKSLVELGANKVKFVPVSTSAKVYAKVSFKTGVVFQMGRHEDQGGNWFYRYRLAASSARTSTVGLDVSVEGDLDLSGFKESFEEAIDQVTGKKGFLSGLETGTLEKKKELLEGIGLPADMLEDVEAASAKIVSKLKEGLNDRLKVEVSARAFAYFSKTTATQTLLQWTSKGPINSGWDDSVKTALSTRDPDKTYEAAEGLGDLCQVEEYLKIDSESRKWGYGFGIKISSFFAGSESTGSVSFVETNDKLLDRKAISFSSEGERLVGRANDSEFGKVSFSAKPVDDEYKETFDCMEYAVNLNWATDRPDDISRSIEEDEVGHGIDWLYSLGVESDFLEEQKKEFEKTLAKVKSNGWLKKKGVVSCSLGTGFLSATDFCRCARTFDSILTDFGQLALFGSAALEWRKKAHRETLTAREAAYSDFFALLFKNPREHTAARVSLKRKARSNEISSEMRKDLKRELKPRRFQGSRGSREYVKWHPFSIARDFPDVVRRLQGLSRSMSELSALIEEKETVSFDAAYEWQKRFIKFATAGSPFEFRLCVLLLAHSFPLESVNLDVTVGKESLSYPTFKTGA
ncbi:MAG: hypothetical protein AAGJ81_15560 [Verrucomicrobiota bacterium]